MFKEQTHLGVLTTQGGMLVNFTSRTRMIRGHSLTIESPFLGFHSNAVSLVKYILYEQEGEKQ